MSLKDLHHNHSVHESKVNLNRGLMLRQTGQSNADLTQLYTDRGSGGGDRVMRLTSSTDVRGNDRAAITPRFSSRRFHVENEKHI